LSTVTARYLKASDNSVVKELFFQILNAAWMNETNWNKKKSWWKTSVKMPFKKSVKWLKSFENETNKLKQKKKSWWKTSVKMPLKKSVKWLKSFENENE